MLLFSKTCQKLIHAILRISNSMIRLHSKIVEINWGTAVCKISGIKISHTSCFKYNMASPKEIDFPGHHDHDRQVGSDD